MHSLLIYFSEVAHSDYQLSRSYKGTHIGWVGDRGKEKTKVVGVQNVTEVKLALI